MVAVPIDEEEITNQLPATLRRWMTFERFHLYNVARFQNRSRDPAFDPKYFPQHGGPFRLPCFWIDRRHLFFYEYQDDAVAPPNLFSSPDSDGRVLWPLHPSCVDRYTELLSAARAQDASAEGLTIWALPTASTRTLLAWPDGQPSQARFIKTTLHSPIFGDRRLRQHIVARSVGLSKLVHEARPLLPEALTFLSERVGFVPRRMLDSGVIVRTIPREVMDGSMVPAPLFSLLGGAGHHRPLLLTLLQESDISPLGFVEEYLCASFARLWLELCLRFGLILEAHSQDLLLALSADDLTPAPRFLYRDFEGLQVDWEGRSRLGLPSPSHLPRACAWRETYNTLGYRYCDFTWYKLRVSLHQYLNHVLHETENSLRDWHAKGLIHVPQLNGGDITMMFSRHIDHTLRELFGSRARVEFDVRRSPHKLVLLLFDLRKHLAGRDHV